MIIHINGVSGSGKSTLGEKISKNKNVLVFDTDDIDDFNALKMINSDKYQDLFTDENMPTFFEIKEKKNMKMMQKILEKVKDQSTITEFRPAHFKALGARSTSGACTPEVCKIIVIVGMTIIPPNADYKYCIKTDPDTNFRFVNSRVIDDMCNNHKKIKELLKSDNSIHKIAMILLHQYKIRVPVPKNPPAIIGNIKQLEEDSIKKNYKIMSVNDIYKEVIEIISNY